MRVHLETAHESLSRHNEELQEDKVEIIRSKNAVNIILADGMGSGVKTNIIATVTSRMISTMLSKGASIEEVVEAAACMLPFDENGKSTFKTFSILQIHNDGTGYLADFDSPSAFRIRKGIPQPIETQDNVYCDKHIREGHFDVKPNDMFIMTSEGILPSGTNSATSHDWNWGDFEEYIKRVYKRGMSPQRLAKLIISAFESLSTQKSNLDATIVAVKARKPARLILMAGPPKDKNSDSRVVGDFIGREGLKAVCGTTAAGIVARESGNVLNSYPDLHDPKLRPRFELQGVFFAAPGTETLTNVIELLQPCISKESGIEHFLRIDGKDSACILAKCLLEEITSVDFMMGTGGAPESGFPSKEALIEKLAGILQAFDKEISIEYC